MKTKLFAFLGIALIGLTLSISFIGCKKDKPADEPTMEEGADTDMPSEESE